MQTQLAQDGVGGSNSPLTRVLLLAENVMIILCNIIKLHCFMHLFIMDRAIPAVEMVPFHDA